MNKKLGTLFTSLLCLTVAFGAAACGGNGGTSSGTSSGSSSETPSEIKTGGSIILGSATELTGSFGSAAWGNIASDNDIRTLTNGYATVQQTKEGEYVWDETVTVKSHETIENEDGSKTFKITINEGLKYSDGSDITAKDYVAYTLAMSSPVVLETGVSSTSGSMYVGSDVYNSATSPTPFSGIRLYEDGYTFSYTITAENFPYYYEDTYASFLPYSPKLWLGADVEIKDDGEGAYLSEEWYAKTADGHYVKAEQLTNARYATTERPCSGPYKFVSYDKSAKTCTLTINEYFQGNYEGQKPHIQNVTYVLIESATMLDQFKTGQVDILSGLATGSDINAALDLVKQNPSKYAYTNYLRSGYGRMTFVCDFGPTSDVAVRQALNYLLDKTDFATAMTGGYGGVVYGPYGMSSWMYQETKDTLTDNLNPYDYSVENAKKVLNDAGWVYNADGSAYNETTGGVRYKKLSAEEAANSANTGYKAGAYSTVKVGNDYYMPLSINWFAAAAEVADLLTAKWVEGAGMKAVGAVINRTDGDFTALSNWMYRAEGYSTPTYGIFTLGMGITAIYDFAGYYMTPYSKSNVTYAGVTACEGATFTEADKDKYTAEEQALIEGTFELYMTYGSCNRLPDAEMDKYTWDMVYTATDKASFLENWVKYIERFNELVPDIPLYSNLYHDVYNAKIGGYDVNPYWEAADAVLYCYDKTAQ